jgi:hypothetical protein
MPKSRGRTKLRFLVTVEIPVMAEDEDDAENSVLDSLEDIEWDGEPSVADVKEEE